MEPTFTNREIAYKVVYESIMGLLDKGVAPWRTPWKGSLPMNAVTKRPYRGINLWILWCQPFNDPRWLTFNQIKAQGGTVKKGSKSVQVVFWSIVEKIDANGKKSGIPFLRYFNVFNVEQVEGLSLTPLHRENFVPNQTADEVVDNFSDCKIKEGKRAAYYPRLDEIEMPSRSLFDSDDQFYCTLFHEMIHSTGHGSRLNRPEVVNVGQFGTESYSEEELVAEMGAAFVSAYCGIESTVESSAAYIAGWKKKLADSPKILIHAASKAQKACDWLLKDFDEDAEVVSEKELSEVA